MNKAEGKRDGGAGALVQSAGQAYTARARLPPSVLVAHAPLPVSRRDRCARHHPRRPSLTPILPRSLISDRSAPRARDSRHKVVCTRPQAQIVGLGLLHPPIGGRPLAVKSSSSTWPPTASSRCHPATRTRCEPGGPREAVICAAGTSWGTLRRLPSSVCVLDASWQAFGSC